MKIAVDGMGGDYAPEEVVKGAVDAVREYGVAITLVGPHDKMEQELAKHDYSGLDIEVIHTSEYLLEGEPPAYALRRKPIHASYLPPHSCLPSQDYGLSAELPIHSQPVVLPWRRYLLLYPFLQ